MPRVEGFAPIARRDARILILGSMPGVASLRAGQYYAHPRNHFWPLLGDLLGFDAAASYARRVRAVTAARIAVWDVLQSCVREGSLDTAIEDDTLEANDFAQFFSRYRNVLRVYFNGAKAEDCYRRHVLPHLEASALDYRRLPSTSPANASQSYRAKLAAWRCIRASGAQSGRSRDLRGARAAARS